MPGLRDFDMDMGPDKPIQVERSGFQPETGFQYYVYFKPHMEEEGGEVHHRLPIQTSVSVSETGDLADLSFEVPKRCRNDLSLSFIRKYKDVSYTPPRLFVPLPGQSGDAQVNADANLDLDIAGRIVGMEIQWDPHTDPRLLD